MCKFNLFVYMHLNYTQSNLVMENFSRTIYLVLIIIISSYQAIIVTYIYMYCTTENETGFVS